MCQTDQINDNKVKQTISENKTQDLQAQSISVNTQDSNSNPVPNNNISAPKAMTKKVALNKRKEYAMIEKWYNTLLEDKRSASEEFQNVKYSFFALKEGMDNPDTDLKEYAKLLSEAYYSVKIYYEGHRTFRYTKKGKERQAVAEQAMNFLKSAMDYLNTELIDKKLVIKKEIDPVELQKEQEYVIDNGFDVYKSKTKPWNEPESNKDKEKDQDKEKDKKKKASVNKDPRLEWQLKPYQEKIKELLKNHIGKTDAMSQKIFRWELERYNENVQMNLATLNMWIKDKCVEIGYVGLENKLLDYIKHQEGFDPLVNAEEFNQYLGALNIQASLLSDAVEIIEKKEKIIALMDKTKDNTLFWRNEQIKKTIFQVKKEDFDVFYENLKEKVEFARTMITGLVKTGFSDLTSDLVIDSLENMMLQSIFLENPTVIRSKVLTALDTPALFMNERKQEQNLNKAMSLKGIDVSYKEAAIAILLKDKSAWQLNGHGEAETLRIADKIAIINDNALLFETSLNVTKEKDGFEVTVERNLTRDEWRELFELKNKAGQANFNELLKDFYKKAEENAKTIDADQLISQKEYRKINKTRESNEINDEIVSQYYYKNIIIGENYLGAESHPELKRWIKYFTNNIDELLFENEFIKNKIAGLKKIGNLEDFEGIPYNEFKKIAIAVNEFVGSYKEEIESLNSNSQINESVRRSIFTRLFKGEITKENYNEEVEKETLRLAYLVQADEQTFNRHLLKGKKSRLTVNPTGSLSSEKVNRVQAIAYADDIWKEIDRMGLRKQFLGLLQLPSYSKIFVKHAIHDDVNEGLQDALNLLSQEKYRVKEGKIKKPSNVLNRINKIIQSKRAIWTSKNGPLAADVFAQLKLCGMDGDLFSAGGEYSDFLNKSESDYKKLQSNLGNNMIKRTLELDELLETTVSKENQILLRDRMSSLLAGIRAVTPEMKEKDIKKIEAYNIRHFGVKNWEEAKAKLKLFIESANGDENLFDHGDIKELKQLIMGKEAGPNGQAEVPGRYTELTEIIPAKLVDFMLEDREEWSKILIHSDEEFAEYKNELKERLGELKTALDKCKMNNFYSEIAVNEFIEVFHDDLIKGNMKKIAKACSLDEEELDWEQIIEKYEENFIDKGEITESENAIRKAYGNNYYNFAADILRQRILKNPELKAVLYNKSTLNDAIKQCNEAVKLSTSYMPKISDMNTIFGNELKDLNIHEVYDAYKDFLNEKMFSEDTKDFAQKIKNEYPQSFIHKYKQDMQEKSKNPVSESEKNLKKSKELLKAGEKANAEVIIVKNYGIKADEKQQNKLKLLRFCSKNNIPSMTRIDLLSEEKLKKIIPLTEERNEEAVGIIDSILKRAAKKNLVKRKISDEVKTILAEKWAVDHDLKLNVPVVGAIFNKITAKVNEFGYRDSVSAVAEKLQTISDLMKKDKAFEDIKDKSLALIYYYKFKGDLLETSKDKILADPILKEYKEREKLFEELSKVKVENRYLALEKADFMENLRTGMVNLNHRDYLDLANDRLKYFKFAEISYKAMDKAIDEYMKGHSEKGKDTDNQLRKETILTGLRKYSRGHILLSARGDKEASQEEELRRYNEILADENKLKYIIGGDSISYMDKIGLAASYEGQYNELDLEKTVMSMKTEGTKDYLAARIKGTGYHDRRREFFALSEEEKKLFALGLSILSSTSDAIGITKYVKGVEKEEEKLYSSKLQVQKFLRTGKIDGNIDYSAAVLKLKKANGNFNVKMFDDAMRFTKFMVEKNERLNAKESNALSDPDRSISFAERYNDFKGLKKLSETKIKDEKDFKNVLFDQMDKDIKLKVNYKNITNYVREGIGHVKERVWVKELKERVENFTPIELHMFIMLLQDRTIFDVKQEDQDKKFKEGTDIGYVNSTKRMALFSQCVEGGEAFDKLFAKSSGANFMQHALKTMCSFQLKDGTDYYNKTLEESDFVKSSLIRTSKFDWLLIKRAINFIDDAKAMRNKKQLISNTSDYIMYSGNIKAINEYKKYESMSQKGGQITQNVLANFIMENAKKDMETDKNIEFLVSRISMLNKQQLALFVRALGHRDMLDLSKKNLVKNVFGKGNRDYQNIKLRSQMLDQHMINGMGGGFEKLTEKELFEAIKGMLSTQINDDKKLKKFKNADVKSNIAAEKNLVEQRTTAIDWKLVRRALLFVTDANVEMDTYMEQREMYRMLGNLKNGSFDLHYGVLRKNTEMTFGSVGRFFSIASKPMVDFAEEELKSQIKKLNLDRLSGFIYSCVSEEELNKYNFISQYGDGQGEDFIDVAKNKIKDKINDTEFVKKSEAVKFVKKNLGLENITDATKFLSDGRCIINVEELKDALIDRGKELALKAGKKIVGIDDDDEEDEEETEEETTETEEEEEVTDEEKTTVDNLLSIKDSGSDLRTKIGDIAKDLNSLNGIFNSASDNAAKYESEKIKKQLENENSKEKDKKTKKEPDAETMKALKEISEELSKEDDKTAWDYLKDSDNIKKKIGDSIKQMVRLDRLNLEDGLLGKVASGIETAIDTAISEGIDALVNLGKDYLEKGEEFIEGKLSDLGDYVTEKFTSYLNDDLPESLKPIISFVGVSLGKLTSILAKGKKYLEAGIKIINSGKDIVLGVMNINYLIEEYDRAEEARAKDEELVKQAIAYNKDKDMNRSKLLGRGYLKTIFNSDISTEHFATDDQVMSIVTSVGATFGAVIDVSGGLDDLSDIVANTIKAGVQSAFAIINAIIEHISSKNIVKDYLASDEGKKIIEEAKKGRDKTRAYVKKQDLMSDKVDDRILVQKYLGYDSIDSFAKALGKQAVASLLFSASKFNGLNGEKIIATAIMHIMGMSDSIGKYDEATAEKLYQSLVMHDKSLGANAT